jgi:hypothetical protein
MLACWLFALPLSCQRILSVCDCGDGISRHARNLLARDKRVFVVMEVERSFGGAECCGVKA